MVRTEVVHKWFGQKFYINGSDRSCTEMVQTEVVQKIKRHILCSATFFPTFVPFMK